MVTTVDDWQECPSIEALMAARSSQFVDVEFRRQAPHFVASAPLGSLRPKSQGSEMFDMLQDLASSVSARKS